MSGNGIHLEHVFISIRDVETSLAFYRKIFPDWVVRWEGPSADGGRWVHFGPKGDGQPGYLSLRESPGAPAPDPPYASLRIQHVGFAHPDVEGLRALLAKDGIEPDDSAEDARYRRYYFLDPDGVELEFVQELKGS
jgi:glyoxylase I family protein